MAEVVFYEKPGCINNTKQKKLLAEAGHTVLAKDLLAEDWRFESLRPFFTDKPVSEWFNASAPRIKSAEVDPAKLSELDAINAMMADPLLIRRPLMRVADDCRVGFEVQWVDEWIGLQQVDATADLESCPRSHGAEAGEIL